MPNEQTKNTPRQDIVAFLNEIGNVHADRVNPAYKSKYASLSEILDTVKAIASKHNLCVHQRIDSSDGQLRVSTSIVHSLTDGVMDCGSIAIKSETLDAQKLGSALTYLRRQALQTACGISVDIDDDGARASAPAPAKSAPASAGPWYSFLTAIEAERAHEYLAKKGWLSASAQSLDELPAEKVELIINNKPAFIKAIK